jgi:hypothetical protein
LTRVPDAGRRRPRLGAGLATAGAFAALLAVGLTLGIQVIVDGYSPVPFADFWGQFPFLERAVGGDLRLGDLWAQANEHRILVPRLEFLLDYRLFDGTNIFLFSTIAASCLALAATIAAAVWLETQELLPTWCAFSAAAISTMSPVGVENLTWAFQVQFVQVFLFACLAIVTTCFAARQTSPMPRRIWTVGSAVTAILATYSMANGLLVWPVVLLLAVLLDLGRRSATALGAVATLAVCSYLWHFDFSTRGSLSHPLGLLKYVAVYLGSGLREAGTATAGVAGGVGLALFGLLCVTAWRRRRGWSIATPAGAGIALFVLLSALQTAAGRLDLGVAQALSSRYSIASFSFWLGLLLGFLTPIRERVHRAGWAIGPAYFGAAAVIALVVALTAVPSHDRLRSIVAGKEVTVTAYRAGVDDPGGTTTGGPSGSVVSDTFRWMERHRLGPWAPGGLVDGMRFEAPSTSTSPACRGVIESVEPVTGGLRLRGWLAPPVAKRTSQNLAVLDGHGDSVGLGRVGTYRPDVEASGAASSDWTGFVAYSRGRPEAPIAVVLVGEDRRSAVCRLQAPSGG